MTSSHSGGFRSYPSRPVSRSCCILPKGEGDRVLCFVALTDHVRGGILSLLLTLLLNLLSHFRFYKVPDKMRMEPELADLAFCCVTEIAWSLSGGSDEFFSYDFGTGAVQGSLVASFARVKHHKVDDNLVVLEFAFSFDVSWVPGVAGNTISDVERDYRWY